MRYPILDGFRGFFLLFMAVAHYDGLIGGWLGNIHHQHFGWVEDAQGFVFISGLVVGLVYGKRYLRAPGVRAVMGPILERVRTIYSHQAGLVLILLGAALALGAAAAPDLAPYRDAPATFTISSLLLLSASANMGILPMYVCFLVVTPFAFAVLHRGWVAPFFAAVMLAWVAAQTQLAGYVFYLGQSALNGWGLPVSFGLYFNLLGWQVLFFGGLFVGFRAAEGRLDLGFLRGAQWRAVFFLCLGAFALLGLYDVLIENLMMGADYSNRILMRSDRSILGLIHLAAFAVDLYLVVWLLVAGTQDRSAAVRRAAGGLAWFFTRPFLVTLGRHSLHVFSWHILVYYLLATVMPLMSLSPGGRALVLILSVASLYLAAFGHRRLQEGGTRAAGPVGAG